MSTEVGVVQLIGVAAAYIRLDRGRLYLAAIMDWYSRALGDGLDTSFVLEAVEEGFGRAKPEILNSDQGGADTPVPSISSLFSALVFASAWTVWDVRLTTSLQSGSVWRSLKYEPYTGVRTYGSVRG